MHESCLVIRRNAETSTYSRHRLIRPPRVIQYLSYYPGEFYVQCYNEYVQRNLVLLSGVSVINRCPLYWFPK